MTEPLEYRLRVVDLQPGQLLIIEVPGQLTEAQAVRIRAAVEQLGIAPVVVMATAGGRQPELWGRERLAALRAELDQLLRQPPSLAS